jgi:hypothetical protein
VRKGDGVRENGILVLGAEEVGALLAGREREMMAVVGLAYRAYGAGQSGLPHSTFLRFPGDDTNRIIALPAFLGDGFQVAGMKWIASFPGNVERGPSSRTNGGARPEITLLTGEFYRDWGRIWGAACLFARSVRLFSRLAGVSELAGNVSASLRDVSALSRNVSGLLRNVAELR